MDRPVTDERLDRAIQDYLLQQVDEIAFQGAGVVAVSERIASRLAPVERRGIGGWRILVVAGLALAALAVMAIVAGAQLVRPSPIPDPPAVCEGLWPGYRLLSSDAADVSIQVPGKWGRSMPAVRGFRRVLTDGTGNAGLAVQLPPEGVSDLEATVGALMADPDVAAAKPYTRTEVMHGTHRAVRLENLTPPLGYVGGRILYIVERAGNQPVVVDLGWDSVPHLGLTEEAILRSLNPDGSGPAVVASYPSGSIGQVTKNGAVCRVAP